MEESFDLIECYICGKKSYLVDILNHQGNQLYPGKCLECEVDTFVRKCSGCDRYYHPNKSEYVKKGKFFNSSHCSEFYYR